MNLGAKTLRFLITFSLLLCVPIQARPIVLAHYMPWYAAKPHTAVWGWHWTMNSFDPDHITNGRPQIASHYLPLIGPYDSEDPALLEYHALLMKLAGIDGVIVDWYGRTDLFDYAALHRNTAALTKTLQRVGLRFAICYEDQTIPKLVRAGRVAVGDRVLHARREIDWLREHWFTEDHYVRMGGKPLLMSFGSEGLTDEEWQTVLSGAHDVVYVSQQRIRPSASGLFDWPVPRDYPASLERFEKHAKDTELAIPVAFPRFHDIYEQGKARASFGRIPDEGGRTWRNTLERAMRLKPEVIQLATWNDWGEGTGIEPTVEFGYRDLEVLQTIRRIHMDPSFPFQAADLRIPCQLLQQRRMGNTNDSGTLDLIARQIADGELQAARVNLTRLEAKD